VNKKDSHSCAGCHNPHSADLTINREYAQSAHGNALDDPWTHYDWKNSSRQACQQCHTSTGFKNFDNSLINGTVYNAANNDFSYLAGNTDGSTVLNDQNETLYCWACHTDYVGDLRKPPAITPLYKLMSGATISTITFPDESGSNVCLACHSGRSSGANIQASTSNFSNTSFTNSHFLAAGGIMFRAVGYNFPGRDYTDVPYYKHSQIGLPSAGSAVDAATGTNGSCVGCHMHSETESHLLMPVTKDGDTITAITSNACAVCHTGNDNPMTVSVINNEREGFEAAMQALNDQLKLKGFCFVGSSTPTTTASGCATKVSNWTNGVPANGKPNMGAAFNYYLLENEQAAYVHNRYYAKRLIYDSIDWIDDGHLNGSVYGTLNALDPSTYPYRDQAMQYLLIGSTNTTADRP
jgi:hypothetical protein